MTADTLLPHPFEQVWITLSDGTRLAGRLWRPLTDRAVPVVLEWIPYRQSDCTAIEDSMMHGWFAAQGFAALRVDLRGSGNSDGTLQDEYTGQEQDDACEVIAWAAAQDWSNGNVGMIGISWGGFAALQVAARRPPALKAIITCCSTDDRYADDVHFMGGALLNDGLSWGAGLFTQIGRPPDPAHVGDRWRAMWQERMEAAEPPLSQWLDHLTRDAYWKHASVCESYADIQCAVYAVTGWTDGYSDPVLRLMENLTVPRKGLIGPWTHMYPTWGKPGPKIGFLQEAVRWWRQWLGGEETGIMDEPMLRLWVGRDLKPDPRSPEIDGRWIGLPSWPVEATPEAYYFDDHVLARTPSPAGPLVIDTPQHCGLYAGEWCPLDGGGDGPEFQADNRYDDALSVCFDTPILTDAVAVVGIPSLSLDLALAGKAALLAIRLCEIAPDGTSGRVTFGLHRISLPEGVLAGQRFRATLTLKGVAYEFSPGCRMRLAISTNYWPMAWPEPTKGAVTIWPTTAIFCLPPMPHVAVHDLPAFAEPLAAAPIAHEVMVPGTIKRTVTWDASTGRTEQAIRSTRALWSLDELTIGGDGEHIYTVDSKDGASAVAHFRGRQSFERPGWSTAIETSTEVRREGYAFVLTSEMTGSEDGAVVFSRRWVHRFEDADGFAWPILHAG
ncbi:CocE/NonD family hydrolase [Acidisoma cladoniae]|uniref:CocE/NonD family hydrolase n=1 Tax=Acidisoma cladoniae TaxID=3040935 RepID=UPI00255185D4|nr:CocE/NonD family hydrolase [Acidisoma sp. PAMC 29798]